MKRRIRELIAVTLLLATPVWADAWYRYMDDAEHPPHRYGYHIARADKDGESHFTVSLDRPAAIALIKPSLQSSTGVAPTINFDRSKIDATGRSSFHFTVPTEDLKNFSLRLDSAPVKYCGKFARDFAGYALNLKPAPIPSSGQNEIQITAQKKNDTFEFRILRRPQMTISTPLGTQRVVSARLTGPVSGGTFTLTIPETSLNLGSHFTLPAAALPGFVLMVDSVPYGINVTSPQIRTEYFGLGIVAANLEAEEESANADKNPAPPAPTR